MERDSKPLGHLESEVGHLELGKGEQGLVHSKCITTPTMKIISFTRSTDYLLQRLSIAVASQPDFILFYYYFIFINYLEIIHLP